MKNSDLAVGDRVLKLSAYPPSHSHIEAHGCGMSQMRSRR